MDAKALVRSRMKKLAYRGERKDSFNPLVNLKVYTLVNAHDKTQATHWIDTPTHLVTNLDADAEIILDTWRHIG